uniref:Uncharacterized protein n=1 Tax=Romanomermis culicivorax TaxID=13658 RepID=A0A915HSP4_ROMCU
MNHSLKEHPLPVLCVLSTVRRPVNEQPVATQQKAQETTGQTSSQTGATLQPKVTTTKTAAPTKQRPPACQSDSHHSHQSHHCDDCHQKETKQSPCKDTTSPDSHQQECCDNAPPHRT